MNTKFGVKLLTTDGSRYFENNDIVEINLVEDIFSWTITGSILFYDRFGFTEQLELAGTNIVTITWIEEDTIREKSFIIYDYNKIIGENYIDSNATRTLWYLSEIEFLLLSNKTYSKSWGENVKISSIVKDIASSMLKINTFTKFEDTKEDISNFYIPYWTPLESLSWLMRRASSERYNVPGYVFFSNSKGFNFRTIEGMMNDTDREQNSNGQTTKYIFTGEGDDFYNKVLNWYINPSDMMSFKYLSGGRYVGYDFKTKSIIDNRYTYKDSINKYSIFGNTTLFPDISDQRSEFNYSADSDSSMIDNQYYDKFIRRYIKQFSVGIVVKGHTKRYAGMVIDVAWPSADKVKRTNKMYEGLYLVRSITHQLTSGMDIGPQYRQLMICVKAGYNEVDDVSLMKINKNRIISDSYLSTYKQV